MRDPIRFMGSLTWHRAFPDMSATITRDPERSLDAGNPLFDSGIYDKYNQRGVNILVLDCCLIVNTVAAFTGDLHTFHNVCAQIR